MFENENSQDSVTEESSQGSEEGSTSEKPAQEGKAPAEPKQEQYVPYDRFKELVEDKNRFAKQFEDTQRELHSLRQQFQQSQRPSAPAEDSKLVAMLKKNGVEAEFIEHIKQQESTQKELQDLRQWRDTQSQQTTQQQAMSQFDKLCADNKVPDSAKETYLAMIRHKAISDPRLGVQDMPAVFKSIHDAQAKYSEELKRTAIAEYTKAKKSDSTVPASSKGQAPKSGGKPSTFSKDPETARSQITERILQKLRQGAET